MKPDQPDSGSASNLPNAERIAYLIVGYLRKTLTDAEHDELDNWLAASDENLRLFEQLTDEGNIQSALDWHMQLNKERALTKIKSELGLKKTGRQIFLSVLPYAIAATLIIGVISIFVFRAGHTKQAADRFQREGPTILPGYDRAVLTLADGRTVILDSTNKGTIATQGKINIQKGNGEELVYTGNDQEMRYNTVSTPRGGQYKLVLGDGTRIWLNAETFIRFPAGFSPAQRMVEVKGEAYFEVAKDPERPFKVKILTPGGDGGTVQVLGTHFNVNSYMDEAVVKTTLIEGSVRGEKDGKTVMLRPNEQALTSRTIRVVPAEVRREVAWKDGVFFFHDATIQNIAAQLKRWYDIEVDLKGNISFHFNGTIDRNEPLDRVLSFLEATRRVHFTLDGNHLTIQP